MSKFNAPVSMKSRATSPVVSIGAATTHEGGVGAARNAKSDLFLLAVANMVGEGTFYETASARDDRFEKLVRQVAVEDPDWMGRFVPWLRSVANMRSAAIVAACEAVKARLDAAKRDDDRAIHDSFHDAGTNRRLIAAACQRADEPGEVLAYWTGRYGRALPKPVKRGVADAVGRLYNEYSFAKYDSDAKGYRFGDVIDLVHPAAAADKPWQGDLFRHALDRRHNRDNPVPETLGKLTKRARLLALPVDERRGVLLAEGGAQRLAEAGMTWEALAGWLQGPMDRVAWEAVIPSMGLMALARNLRNFDQAGVSDAVAAQVAAKFADAEQVARSRMLPFRWLSAHRAAPSLRWSYPLEQALGHSLANIPRLAGRTLILVDTSTSMDAGFSKDGTLMRWDAAALFGIALGHRCAHADVVSFSSAQQFYGDRPGPRTKAFPMAKGESVLRSLQRWKGDGYFLGGGTDTAGALRSSFARHDRVVIVTDEQAAYDPVGVSGSIPANVPMFTWNLAGYQAGHAQSGGANRHTFGGLTDQAFKMIPLLEAGASQSWPF